MTPVSARETRRVELMDDPACDPERLRATYRQFGPLNRLVSGWRAVYLTRIRPLLAPDRPVELLDLGCGGGDLARALASWATRDGLVLRVTAVDPDPRAIAFARERPHPGVRLREADSAELVDAGERFDLVVSNHVLHHLARLDGFLHDSARLAPRVIHNDIRRSRAALALYAPATLPFARGSFIHQDGTLSIRRSYTAPELRAAVPAGWRVESHRPFRLLLTHGMPGRRA